MNNAQMSNENGANQGMFGIIHLFHIHGTQFKNVSYDGMDLEPNEQGFKDSVKVQLYLEHEDNGMMRQIEMY